MRPNTATAHSLRPHCTAQPSDPARHSLSAPGSPTPASTSMAIDRSHRRRSRRPGHLCHHLALASASASTSGFAPAPLPAPPSQPARRPPPLRLSSVRRPPHPGAAAAAPSHMRCCRSAKRVLPRVAPPRQCRRAGHRGAAASAPAAEVPHPRIHRCGPRQAHVSRRSPRRETPRDGGTPHLASGGRDGGRGGDAAARGATAVMVSRITDGA